MGTWRIEAGIGDDKSEILEEPSLFQVDAIFKIVSAVGSCDISLDAPVQKLAVRGLRSRKICERVAAWIVIELIFSNVRIDREQRVRAKCVLVAGCKIPRQDPLMLVLRQLIEVVWNLNPISRCEQIEVKNILAARLVIKPVEDGLAVTDVVNPSELRGIEKPSTTSPIKRDEVPYFCISEAKRNAAASGAESSIIRFNFSERASGSEARTSRNLSDQATLVAKFSGRSPRDNFHTLDGTYGKLGGKDFALLIADGLPIDDKAGLGVIAHWVEETLPIGNHAAGPE